MKQGYTKKVLEAQIGKYEDALKMNNRDFNDWVHKFGSWNNCPVCHYRNRFTTYESVKSTRKSPSGTVSPSTLPTVRSISTI